MQGSGAVLEGTQTNFYAVRGGVVYTAEEGVLPGTVRSLVLDVCRDAGIDAVLEAPSVAELGEWEGAFITSTSRFVMPIDSAVVPASGARRDFDNSRPDSVVRTIERRVAEAAAARAVDVLGS